MTRDNSRGWTQAEKAAMDAAAPRLRANRIEIELDGGAALQLLMFLQLAANHPDPIPPLRWRDPAHEPIHRLAADLQAFVSITPEFAALAAAGWDPDNYRQTPAGRTRSARQGQ